MKRLLAVCSIIVFMLTSVARADLFSNASKMNETRFYSLGGYIYQNTNNVPSSSPLIDLGYSIANAGTCGGFNLGASLKSIFNIDAAGQYLKNLGANAISSAPLLLMSYASPTLANVFMHLKDSAERILALRNQQCEEVEKAAMKAGILLRAKQEGRYRCMMQEQKEGKTIEQAAHDCLGASDVLSKYIPLTAPSDKQLAQKLNLSKEIKQLTGMDSEEYSIFKEAVGDITLDGNSLLDQERKDPIVAIYNKDVALYNSKLETLVNKVGMGIIDKKTLEEIRKETGVTILPSSIVELYDLKKIDPYSYSIFQNMLANRLALHRLNEEILTVEADLEIAQEKAKNQGNGDIASLLNKKNKLELERKKLIEREKAAEDMSNMLLAIHEERIREAVMSTTNGTENTNAATSNQINVSVGVPSRTFPRKLPPDIHKIINYIQQY